MDANEDSGRKFGLPNWMVNNIERLNFVTDIEQYGCSPPENDSFLTEYMENADRRHPSDPPPTTHEEATQEVCQTRSTSFPSHLGQGGLNHPVVSRLHSMRQEDSCSSPDTTPAPTPEPSPVIRRKISIPRPDDTLLTNPGGWFYMGKLRKNKGFCPQGTQEADMSSVKPKKSGLKLVITNFDLNAVSPNSW